MVLGRALELQACNSLDLSQSERLKLNRVSIKKTFQAWACSRQFFEEWLIIILFGLPS
jgi:hypothetical protein